MKPTLTLVEPVSSSPSLSMVTIPMAVKGRAEAYCAVADKIRRALLTGQACPEATYAEAVALLDRKRP